MCVLLTNRNVSLIIFIPSQGKNNNNNKKIVHGQGAPNITTMLFLRLILPTCSHSVASTNYG